MELRNSAVAIACGLIAVLVLGVGVAMAGSPKKAAKAPCMATQATGTNACTRTWVKAGCKELAPLAESVFGVPVSVASVKVTGRAGPGALVCGLQPAGGESFQFMFMNAGAMTASQWAQFKADEDETGFITGCVPTSTSDPSTATPRTNAQPIVGLGAESGAFDICSGGGYGVWKDGTVTAGPSTAQAVVQLGHTQRRVTGGPAGPPLAKLVAFAQAVVKKYP